MTSRHEVLAMILLRWRSGQGAAPVYPPSAPGTFRAEALKLLAAYGADGVERQVELVRNSEAAEWQRVEWAASPRMTRREAELAGRVRSEAEAPWLWASTGIEAGGIGPGPATGLAPRNVIDKRTRTNPITREDSTSPSWGEQPPQGSPGSRSTDEALLASARDLVATLHPGLAGQARDAQVYVHFDAMRRAQRDAAKGAA